MYLEHVNIHIYQMTETYYTSSRQKQKYRENEQAVMSTTTIIIIQ